MTSGTGTQARSSFATMTRGWAMDKFGAGWTAAVPMTFTLADLQDSLDKLPSFSSDMRARLAKQLEIKIFSTVSPHMGSSGLFLGTGRSSMNSPLGYMSTAAGLAAQFPHVAAIIGNSSARMDTVQSVFRSFCQRMCDGPTLEALSLVQEYPSGGESVMILFLEHLKRLRTKGVPLTEPRQRHVDTIILNMTRHLKAMEIESSFLASSNRMFLWTDRGVRMAARDMIPNKELYKEEVKQWSCKVTRKEQSEPKSAIDDGIMNIFECKYKADTEMVIYHWHLKLSEDGLLIAKGNAASLEDAADQLYRAFYKALTKKRYVDASMVKAGTELVIFGNWITNEEYMEYKNKRNLQIVSDASDDSRDAFVFVIGWPCLARQKALVKAHKVRKARSYGEMTADNVIVELRSGFTLDATDHFYVYHSERKVEGEICCTQCATIGLPTSMGAIAVYGRGLHCGPCIDYLMGEGKLEDDTFDLAEILAPSDTQTIVGELEE